MSVKKFDDSKLADRVHRGITRKSQQNISFSPPIKITQTPNIQLITFFDIFHLLWKCREEDMRIGGMD